MGDNDDEFFETLIYLLEDDDDKSTKPLNESTCQKLTDSA